MITGDIKQKVDDVWQTFWNNGFTQPSAIFEQITYLLFMKMLDDKQREKEAIANLTGDVLLNPTFPSGTWHNPSTNQDVPYNEMRWHVFKELEPSKMLDRVRNYVFIYLRYVGKEGSAYRKAMEDTVFQITNARLLSRVVEGIEELASDGADMMGDIYEYMLGKMAASGTNGQFRTPRHIIRMMVELMRPTLDDIICDPAMGSAGFIMEAAKYIAEHQGDELLNIDNRDRYRSEIFHGSDSDASMLRIGCMNMMLHDVDEPNLYYRNSLSDENNDTNRYTLCLANPPFAGSLDTDDIAHTLKAAVKTKKTELLFLALFLRLMQKGGCFKRADGVHPSYRIRFSQAMHKPTRPYDRHWWISTACKPSSRCLPVCSNLIAESLPPSLFLPRQAQAALTRFGFTICMPMGSRSPRSAFHSLSKTIFPISSPVSTTSKRKPTAVAKSNRSLSLPMKYVPTATTSAISVITK